MCHRRLLEPHFALAALGRLCVRRLLRDPRVLAQLLRLGPEALGKHRRGIAVSLAVGLGGRELLGLVRCDAPRLFRACGLGLHACAQRAVLRRQRLHGRHHRLKLSESAVARGRRLAQLVLEARDLQVGWQLLPRRERPMESTERGTGRA